MARLVPEHPKQLIVAQTSTTALFHSSPPLNASPHHVRVIMTRGNPFFPNLFSLFQSILVAGLVKFGCPSSLTPQTRTSGCRADHHDHQASAKVSLFLMGISIHVQRLFIQTLISDYRWEICAGCLPKNKMVSFSCLTYLPQSYTYWKTSTIHDHEERIHTFSPL